MYISISHDINRSTVGFAVDRLDSISLFELYRRLVVPQIANLLSIHRSFIFIGWYLQISCWLSAMEVKWKGDYESFKNYLVVIKNLNWRHKDLEIEKHQNIALHFILTSEIGSCSRHFILPILVLSFSVKKA